MAVTAVGVNQQRRQRPRSAIAAGMPPAPGRRPFVCADPGTLGATPAARSPVHDVQARRAGAGKVSCVTVVVLTGATRGIGRAAAIELARRGAEVVLVGRDPERVRLVAEEATTAGGGGRVHGHVCGLSLMSNVRVLADEIRGHHEHVDVLANNAGALFASRKETSEGLEQTFALNHLAPFLLTNLLRDRLAGGRVVTTASGAHRSGRLDLDDLQSQKSYSPRVYGTSKLCNILFTRELARRAPELNANCFHPGVVRTGFAKNENGIWKVIATLGAPFLRSPERGAPPWCGSPYPTTPPTSPGSTSNTNRWSPPATRPRTTTSHGACGNKAPSSSACLPTRAPNAPAQRPPSVISRASGPRPSSVPVCAEGTLLEVASRGIRKPIGLLARAVSVPVATRTRCGSGARARAGRVRRWLSRRRPAARVYRGL